MTLRIETTAGALKAALKMCEYVVERRYTIPALTMIKFSGNRVFASDLDLQIEVTFPVIAADGEALVMFDPLRKLVNTLQKDEAVTIVRSENVIEVLIGSGRYKLPSGDVADFPIIELGEELKSVALDGDAFGEALSFCAPAISTDDTRYYLNGVCLSGRSVVATDGHRLAVTYDAIPVEVVNSIIPRKAIRLLLRLPSIPSFSIFQQGRHKSLSAIVVRCPGVVVTSKLIDGTFPDWTRVIPKNTAATVACDLSALRRKLKRISAVANNMTSLSLVGDGQRIGAAMRNSTGYAADTAAQDYVDARGHAFEGAFNLRYVGEALASLQGETLSILSEDIHSPFIFKSDVKDNRIFVVMPQRDSPGLGDAKTLLSSLRQDLAA